MSSKKWFSSKVRLICLIESDGARRYQDSIFIFQSNNFTNAFKKALKLGKELEESYSNSDNQKVLWRLKEIISLDIIDSESLDEVEVYSEPVELSNKEKATMNTKFYPEKSEPTQTI